MHYDDVSLHFLYSSLQSFYPPSGAILKFFAKIFHARKFFHDVAANALGGAVALPFFSGNNQVLANIQPDDFAVENRTPPFIRFPLLLAPERKLWEFFFWNFFHGLKIHKTSRWTTIKWWILLTKWWQLLRKYLQLLAKWLQLLQKCLQLLAKWL